MTYFHPTQSLSTVDPEALADKPNVKVTLPDPRGQISTKEYAVVVREAKATLPQALTWAEAVAELRKQHLRGRQPDFNMVTSILAKRRAENAHEPIVVDSGQHRMLMRMAKALARQEKLGFDPIDSAIASEDPQILLSFRRMVLACTTQGQYSDLRAKFEANFGWWPPRSITEESGETSTPQATVEDTTTKDGEPEDEEPF